MVRFHPPAPHQSLSEPSRCGRRKHRCLPAVFMGCVRQVPSTRPARYPSCHPLKRVWRTRKLLPTTLMLESAIAPAAISRAPTRSPVGLRCRRRCHSCRSVCVPGQPARDRRSPDSGDEMSIDCDHAAVSPRRRSQPPCLRSTLSARCRIGDRWSIHLYGSGNRLNALHAGPEPGDGFAMLFELTVRQEANLKIADAVECRSPQLRADFFLPRVRRYKK